VQAIICAFHISLISSSTVFVTCSLFTKPCAHILLQFANFLRQQLTSLPYSKCAAALRVTANHLLGLIAPLAAAKPQARPLEVEIFAVALVAMALGDLTAQPPPVRIPKLKYRNPLPPAATSRSAELPHNAESKSLDIREPPATPSSKAPSDYQQSFDSASLTSVSLASTTSSVSSSNGSKSSSKKKKKSSVLGFLSLKEPSQVALEQFAEAQRKQQKENERSSPTSRAESIYASKKLPPTVPKVNSKWNGVPEGIKHRHLGTAGKNKNRHSGFSQTTQGSQESRFTNSSWASSKLSVTEDGTRNPPNSIASAADSVSNLTIREDDRSYSPAPSTNTLPEMTYYFPEPLDRGAPLVHPSQPETYRPQIAEAPPRPSISSSEFDLQLDHDHFSDRADSPASSTDSVDTIVRDTADVLFQKLNDRPHKSIWGDANASHHAINEAPVPESHDFLFMEKPSEPPKADSPMTSEPNVQLTPPRPVQNFSRPTPPSPSNPAPRASTTPSYRPSRASTPLPTLYEASLASTDGTDEAQPDDDDNDNDDAYSIAPSTIAPSVMSSRWHDSPRERLGLGGRLRMNEKLPWEDGREALGKPKKNRLSFFSTGSSRS
jgi:hypothetical protein